MATAVVTGLIAAVPATIAALAAWRRSGQTHREVRTNHGLRAGQYIELMSSTINDMSVSIKSLEKRVGNLEARKN